MEVKEYQFSDLGGSSPLTADVFYSPGDEPGQSRPIAIIFYGGGFVAGGKNLVSKAEIESLVGDFGFVVVVPNYRHCPTVSVYEGPLTDGHDCYNWTQTKLNSLLSEDVGINVNSERIAVIGSSTGGLMALHLAKESAPPAAIVAFYAVMYLQDPFWSSPLAALSKIPALPKDFINKVYEEGTVVAVPSSFIKTTSSPTPMPDLSKPRTGWLLTNLKEGTWLKNVVLDGDFDRIDPANLFSEKFPATCFVHGTEDAMCAVRFSEQAHKTLGVDSELLLAHGKPHDFEPSFQRRMQTSQ